MWVSFVYKRIVSFDTMANERRMKKNTKFSCVLFFFDNFGNICVGVFNVILLFFFLVSWLSTRSDT